MIEYLAAPTDQWELHVRVESDVSPQAVRLNEELAANAAVLREFFSAGAILQSQATPGRRVPLSPDILSRDGASFILSFRPWQFGAEGLGVILRVLEHTFGRASAPPARISVAAPSRLLAELADAEEEIPSLDPHLPFAADLHPVDKWLNLECEFPGEMTPDVAERLNRLVHVWVKVGELGGFDSSGLLAELDPPGGPAGIAALSPVVGEDFIQWQFAIGGSQLGAQHALVNMIADFSRREFPISFVYSG